MNLKSQLDLFDPTGGRRGRCDGEFSQPFTNTGARAYAQVGRFEKVPPRTAPTAPIAPCEVAPDPASAYPTKASIAVADKAWDQEYLAWQAAGCPGGPDAWPRPPAGLPSAIADRLIPRRAPQHGKRWR
jgi:hypothetical protein